MKFRVVLPTVMPAIYNFLHYAYPMSLMGLYNNHKSYLYSNFINVSCVHTFSNYAVPLNMINDHNILDQLEHEHVILERNYLHANENLLGEIKERLSQKYYIHLYVNEFYLSERIAYQKYNHQHELLIVGFDDYEKCFITCGYNKNGGGFTRNSKVPYKEFLAGYINFSSPIPYENELSAFCLKNNWETPFDLNSISLKLRAYIESRRITGQHALSFDYMNYSGLETLSLCRANMDYFAKYRDLVPFYTLFEHKDLMYRRIEYLECIGALNPELSFSIEYKEISETMKIINNIYMKYLYTSDEKLLSNIDEKLLSIEASEKDILSSVLNYLKSE